MCEIELYDNGLEISVSQDESSSHIFFSIGASLGKLEITSYKKIANSVKIEFNDDMKLLRFLRLISEEANISEFQLKIINDYLELDF